MAEGGCDPTRQASGYCVKMQQYCNIVGPFQGRDEAAIVDVLQRIMRLLDPPPEPEPPRRQIGFHARPDDEPAGAMKGRKR